MTTAKFTEIFKMFYPKFGPDAVYHKFPILTMVEPTKMTQPTGQITVALANSQKVGSDFAMVTTGSAGDFDTARFQFSQYPLYGVTDFDGPMLRNFESGGGNDQAFENYAKSKLNMLLQSISRAAAQSIYANGKLVLGRVASGTSSPVTLSSRAQCTFIQKGMQLVFAAGSDGTTTRAGLATVTKVDAVNKTVTYTGTITSLAVNDYVFDALSFHTSNPPGLEGWNPETLSSSFLGVDQAVDNRQLAGWRYSCNDSGTEIDTGIAAAIAEHEGVTGERVDFCMINPIDADLIARKMGGKIRYTDVNGKNAPGAKRDVTFTAIQIAGVPLINDSTCPQGVVRGIQDGIVFWGRNKEIPSMDVFSGMRWQEPGQTQGTDIWRGRSFADHCIWTNKPVGLLRIALPTN